MLRKISHEEKSVSRKIHLFLLVIMFTGIACNMSAANTLTPAPVVTTPLPPTAIPSPTPIPPPLVVTIDQTIPLEQRSPIQPVVFFFSQPMDTTSAQPAVLTYPWVDGTTTWSSDFTSLTYTPDTGFSPGQSYRVFLNQDLRSSLGATVPPPAGWQISTLTAPQLIRRAPGISRLDTRYPSIQLAFDHPMDANSVQSALSVTPEIPITIEWQQGFTATVKVEQALIPGVRYRFKLDGSAADSQGIPLWSDYNWDYYLDGFDVLVSGPTFGARELPLTISFAYPVDRQSVQSVLDIQPPFDGALRWDSDTQLSLIPNSSLPADQTYIISFRDGILDSQGAPLPSPEPLTFVTPPPIISIYPSDGMETKSNTTIQVTFDRPMDHVRTEAGFQLSPLATGAFSWQENTLSFTPDISLQDNTLYTVTLTTAISSDGLALLNEPYKWTFRTSQYERDGTPVVSFGDYGANGQVLDVNGRQAIQFVTKGNPGSVRFDLYRIGLEQFLDRYSSGFRGVAGSEHRPISLEGATLQASWDKLIDVPGVGYENNIYETLVPDGLPSGLYILNLSTNEIDDQLLLVLTSNSLMVKQAEGELVAWVTDINGGSIPAAEVSVYARDGVLVTLGYADENGVYRTQVPRDPQPLIVVARVGEDITVSGLNNEWRDGGYWAWWAVSPVIPRYAAYIYTDRPIYKPGQTVFFKAIIRNDDDAAISLPQPGTPVTVRIRDARNNVAQTFELTTNDFGAVTGQFTVAEGAMLGDYTVEVALAVTGSTKVERYNQIFKVQDYRKPDFQVNVTSDSKTYVVGDMVNLTIDASYFFGQPVANAALTLKQYYLYEYSTYWDNGSNKMEYFWYESYGTEVTAVTDSNGQFYYNFAADLGDNANTDYYGGSSLQKTVWGLEVTIDDGSHQTVSNFAAIKVYNAAEKVWLNTGGWLKSPGQAFTVQTVVTQIDGTPVPERAIDLSLRRWNPDNYEYDIVVQSAAIVTGPDGKVSTPFTINETGYYQLRATSTDNRGNLAIDSDYIYAFSGSDFWTSRYSSGIQVTADRDSYAPGDTARLIIESTFSGPALLTFERGRTHREKLVTLTAPITLVDIPIQAEDAPNIFVVVNAYQEQDTHLTQYTYTNLNDSRLRLASVKLHVPVTEKSLNVTITPDQAVYAPRQQAIFTMKVTNDQGQPVSAEVSFAMVDEAIFSLSEELSGPMHDKFYSERSNIVRTFNSMALTRYLFIAGRGGGGGDEGGGNPRTEFPDTAAWYPSLQTDVNGEVVVTITLPDSLTSWRITAKAVTKETQVGEAVVNVITTQEVIVRPLLPRALTAGDSVSLPAAIHNYSQQPLDFNVSMATAANDGFGALQITGPVTQTITLGPGDVQIVYWEAFAQAAGGVDITVRATPAVQNGNPVGDAIRLPLTINPLAVPDVTSQVGAFTGEFVTALYLPENALPISTVKIELSRSVAGTLLTGLEFLTGYPYGCVEQTMSRALPNAVVGRAFNQLGVSNPTLAADLPPLINAGLQRLYGYQHNDGGWGWWYDDSTHDYQTAWVVFGLAVTKEAGYEVDPTVIQRGAKWLSQNLQSMDIRTRAYALYSMALAGQGDLDVALTLKGRVYELDTFSQAALALAFNEMGNDDQAREVIEILAASAENRDGLIYWPQPNEDGHYYDKTMASTTRSTALALDAFVRIQPEHEYIPGIVTWLMSQRRQQGWGSTNETSFAILALTDHLLTLEETTASAGYSIFLNEQSIASGELGRNEPAVSLVVPAAQLQTGMNTLRINQSGDVKLYYSINSRTYLPESEIAAAGKVGVFRQYLDPETGQPLTSVQAGQLVQVQIQINLPYDGFFIILEDKLPGGLEALNEALNTTSHDEVSNYGNPYFYWQEYGYNNKEIRGDRVSFFITEMSAGWYGFTYLARAVTSGTFIAMPAELYAMYDASIWGRSASSIFLVTK